MKPVDGWHVLGAGAVGSLCAAALSASAQQVTLLLRDEGALSDWRAAGGLHWQALSGDETVLSPTVETLSDSSPIEKLLVTTKAYDALEALASVHERLTDSSIVVLLVNGLGISEAIEARFPGLDLYPATTTEGAHRVAPFTVRHAGRGSTLIGQSGLTTAPDWFEPWRQGSLAAQWSADIGEALWQKLAVNCAINPLTAIHSCPNGELASPDLAPQVRLICREIASVLSAEALHDLAKQLEARVFEVIEGTSRNRSSMLQDIEAGRRTEVDYITGHLLQRADLHGLDLPENQALLARVRELESPR